MNKFLERYIKLNLEEIENLNFPLFAKEIELVTKNYPSKKILVNYIKHLRMQ